MATTTPRIGLTKPDGTDLVDIAVLNTNFDKIDSNIASTKIQSTKPTTANAGDLWWDSDTGTLYLYYTDANSSQWVAATSDPINIGVVANQTERDAQYPTPAQGMSVYRTDLGVTQRYYGAFNASTNPGGRDIAGWYDTEKSVGLVPIQPTSAVIATGTGSANSLGVVSFNGATAVSLNGVFTSAYQNYRVIFNALSSSTGSPSAYFRMRVSGTDVSTNTYYRNGVAQTGSSALVAWWDSAGAAGYFTALQDTHKGSSILDFISPALAERTSIHFQSRGWNSGFSYFGGVLLQTDTTAFDGLSLICASGNMTGTVQVFGYND